MHVWNHKNTLSFKQDWLNYSVCHAWRKEKNEINLAFMAQFIAGWDYIFSKHTARYWALDGLQLPPSPRAGDNNVYTILKNLQKLESAWLRKAVLDIIWIFILFSILFYLYSAILPKLGFNMDHEKINETVHTRTPQYYRSKEKRQK